MSEKQQAFMIGGFATAFAAGLGVGGFLMSLLGGLGTIISAIAYFFAIIAFASAVVLAGVGVVLAVLERRNVRPNGQAGRVFNFPPRQGPR